MDAKIRWYQFYNEWAKLVPVMNDKLEKYGTDTTTRGDDFKLNNYGNWIWEHVGRTAKLTNEITRELNRVCGWMEGVVRRGGKDTTYYHTNYWPLYIDTYANLLYKAGKRTEALPWQELAVAKGREYKIGKGDLATLEENLEKMKKGEPTWPIEEAK
jgi:hypothetical protein